MSDDIESVRALIGFICPSNIHRKPVDGTVMGTFNPSHLNGKPPVRVAYCAKCAATGEAFGLFTPDPAPDTIAEQELTDEFERNDHT